MGYSPWGLKESDTTEQLTFSLSYIINMYVHNFTQKRNKRTRLQFNKIYLKEDSKKITLCKHL